MVWRSQFWRSQEDSVLEESRGSSFCEVFVESRTSIAYIGRSVKSKKTRILQVIDDKENECKRIKIVLEITIKR